jgi:hypothetical protein
MAILVPGEEFVSREPLLAIDNPLAPGASVFRLVVVDDDGNQSAPQELTVTVRRRIVRPPRGGGGGGELDPLDPRLVLDPRVVIGPRVTEPRPIDPRVIIRRPG